MVRVGLYTNETEAHLARNYLAAHDIRAEIVGAKEYSAHILGGGAGRFELMVEPIHLLSARDLLAAVEQPNTQEPSQPASHFRRAVFFAVLATIVLPLVFNFYSLREAKLMWQESERKVIDVAKLFLVGILQLFPIFVIWKFFS